MYWLTGIAGALLIIAPYIFGYGNNVSATWVSILSGFVVLIASIWEGMEKQKTSWEYWVAGLVGIFAILSPFIFGFGSVAGATWTIIILGILIAVFSATRIWGGGTMSTGM